MKKCPYQILYEDENVLSVYKERNVFSVATEDIKTRYQNLFSYLKSYAKRKGENIYLVHRLDYETSGVMVFAKNQETQRYLKDCFETRSVIRLYEAVVKENVKEDYHILFSQMIKESASYKVKEDEKGKEAITEIYYGNKIQIGTALRIQIHTGRKNQIRLALHSLSLTLIGDKRYAKDTAKRMYLNSYALIFPKSDLLKESRFITPCLWLIDPMFDYNN